MRFITSAYCILYIPEQENTYDMKVIEAERIFCRMLQGFKGISIKSVLVYLTMPQFSSGSPADHYAFVWSKNSNDRRSLFPVLCRCTR
jgi:hypothetical protein